MVSTLFPFLLLLTLTHNLQSNIQIALTRGSSEVIALSTNLQGYQRYSLSAFTNQNSQATSFLCSLQLQQTSKFNRMGAFQHQRQISPEDFWQGGNLWDAALSGNRILSVIESGQVIELKSKNEDTTFRPFQMKSTIRPLKQSSMPFGRILTFKQPGSSYHTLYFSEEGCYHINEDGSWTKLTGYAGQPFEQAKASGKNIFIVKSNRLHIYSVDLAKKQLTKQQQVSITFREDSTSYPLYISDIQIDQKNQRLYLIDSYEGIKYIPISSNLSTQTGQAQNILPFERCQDILVNGEVTFFSCSNLVIINSTDLRVIAQVRYPFHVTAIFFDQSYLSVFGDNQYAVYSVLMNQQLKLQVEYVLRGNLPNYTFERFFYIPSSKYFILFSKHDIQYGRITQNKYSLLCDFLNVDQTNYHQLDGISTATLSVYGKCPEIQSGEISVQCQESANIRVEFYDLKEYKLLAWFILGLLLTIPVGMGIYKLILLSKKKNSIVYAQFNEETVVTESVSQPQMLGANQKEVEIEMPKV